MAQAINLLPQIAEQEIQRGVYKKKINLIAIASLLFIGAVAVGLFSYQLFLSTQARSIEARTKEKEAEISKKAETEIKQRALIDKLEAVRSYLEKNKSTAAAFRKIIELADTGSVTLTKVDIGSGGAITIAGSSPTSANLGSLFDRLTDSGAQVSLDKVIASNVSLSGGVYQFTIRLNYTKKGVLPERAANEPQEP